MSIKARGAARQKILDAAIQLIRAQGFSASSVDELCGAAGVTKGAFFHYFRSKEELGVAAAAHFSEWADSIFAQAPYRALADPLARLLGYIDFRKSILQGEMSNFTCLLGTMVQEAYATHPAIREACARSINEHAAQVEADIVAALAVRGMNPSWSPRSLALYTQAVIQGAFILAKAHNRADVAGESLDHLKSYIELLFNGEQQPTSGTLLERKVRHVDA